MSEHRMRNAAGPGAALLSGDRGEDLPLWAQALLASRLTRRGVLAMARDGRLSAEDRDLLVGGCEAIERCAVHGAYLTAEGAEIERAKKWTPKAGAESLAQAMHWAADAALAANDASDFSAAETACVNSTWQALLHAAQSAAVNPLQARMFIAADVDLLRFACGEFRIGRYDALGPVIGRLTTIS